MSITVSHHGNHDVDVEPLLLLRKFVFLLGIDICVDVCVAVVDKSPGKQCSIDVKISNQGRWSVHCDVRGSNGGVGGLKDIPLC